MADLRFFHRVGPFTLGDLAERCGAALADKSSAERSIVDVAPLSAAGGDDVSFLDNRKYLAALAESAAGACILHPDLAPRAPAGMALLLSRQPHKSYALAAQAFYPDSGPAPAIAASAVVDETAKVGKDCLVEAGAVIGPRAEIGAGCRIGPNAVIGEAVVIGDDTVVGANASLSHCIIGSRVEIYPGARIGQRGFGFAIDPAGHVKVPQLGRVIVEDDVEIGANAAIDRGAGPDTVIGAGAMIDNLVQIGHNVRIGPRCVIAAQVGMAGSTVLGEMVVMGGQGGLGGHLKIGAGARIAGQSGVIGDLAPGERVMGTPARPLRRFFREIAILGKLAGKTKRSE